MIIKNEVMLSGNYTLSYRYGLEKQDGSDAKTTTIYIIGSPSENTVNLQAVQFQDEGDDHVYYSQLADLDKFQNYDLAALANRLFYYCPLWTGIKCEITDSDAKKIKSGFLEVLQAIEKLNK